MKKIKYFFDCYFNQSFDFEELDKLIDEYKNIECPESRLQLITEFHQIVQTKSFALARRIIKKHGGRTLSLEKTEKFICFLYDRFIDRPTNVKAEDFKRNVKAILCPICCPDSEKIKIINLIQKATIQATGQQIYICKPCKLVWLTEDICADNAQDYKKYMKTLGLKGTWKELSDIDVL